MTARATGILVIVAFLCLAPARGRADGYHLVEVTGPSVVVRDLLLPGMPAGPEEAALGEVIETGLRPGERRLVGPEKIHLQLIRAGVAPVARGWLWPAPVIVCRAARVASSEELALAGEEAVRQELLSPGVDEVVVTPVALPRPLLGPLDGEAAVVEVRRPALAGGLWTCIVSLPGEEDARAAIRYRVAVFAEALVARRPLRRHDPLTAEVVAVERREIGGLRGEPLRSPDELVGQRAARGIAAGTVVTADMLESIPAVRRGGRFVAVARVGPVLARTEVVALAEGGVGDTIRARLADGRQEVTVRLLASGEGEVVFTP